MLFDLLATAELYQFPVIFAKLVVHADLAASLAQAELTKSLHPAAAEDEKEALAQRQAHAAVALFKLGAAEALWPLLAHSPDPRVHSYLIHWMGPFGTDPQVVMRRLDVEPDVTVRRALLLMLGEFSEAQLPEAQREPLLDKLLVLFAREPDSGLHAAVQWLLQKWGRHRAWRPRWRNSGADGRGRAGPAGRRPATVVRQLAEADFCDPGARGVRHGIAAR